MMTRAKDEDDAGKSEEVDVEVEARGSLESLRESVHKIVDDALREVSQVKGRGRHVGHAMAGEMHRIRRTIRGAFRDAAGAAAIDIRGMKEGLRGRTNTVMTRVKDDDLERLDLLVDAGLFESRSECAAFLIHVGLDARRDLVDKVHDTAKRISELKEQLRQELTGESEKA